VDSVTVAGEDNAIRVGEGWQIASAGSGAPNISFTAAQQTAPLYFSNTGDLDIVVDRVVVILGTATGGTGDWLFRLIRNPTGGTLIDNAVSAGISNSNHGATNAYPGVAYRSLTPVSTGAAGTNFDTLTGGSGATQPLKQTIDRVILPVGRRLPQGFSLGCTLTPPTGTTAASALIVAHVFIDRDS
jgi:hypothetical protein